MKKGKGLTNRIVAMLMSGMLAVGAVPGTVLASENQADIGQTSEIAAEVPQVPEGADSEEVSAEAYGQDAVTQEAEASAEEVAVQYYTVTLDANGGYFANEQDDILGEIIESTEILNKIVYAGEPIAALPFYDAENENMIFSGWSLERNGEVVTETGEDYIPANDCTLYAVWKNGATEESEPHEAGKGTDVDADGTNPAAEYDSQEMEAGSEDPDEGEILEEIPEGTTDAEASLEQTPEGTTDAEASLEETPEKSAVDEVSLEETLEEPAADEASLEAIQEESAAEESSLREPQEEVSVDADLPESTDPAEPGDALAAEPAVIADGVDTADTITSLADESNGSETVISEAHSASSSVSDKVVFNGHVYQRFEDAKSWNTAKAYCESLGGHLVTITSREEQNFVANLVSGGSKKQYWLGANSLSGSFRWVTGEAFSYSNWATNEPNHCSGEYYAQMYLEPNPVTSGASFKWNDIREDNTFYNGEADYFQLKYTGFVCEWDELAGKYYLEYSKESDNVVLIGGSGWLQAYLKSTDSSLDLAEEAQRVTWSLEEPTLGTVSVSNYYGTYFFITLRGLLPGDTNLIATFSDGSTFSKKVFFEPEMKVSVGARYENGSIEETDNVISYSNIWCSVSLEGSGANRDYLNDFINQVTFDEEDCQDVVDIIDDTTEVSEDGLTAWKKLRFVGTSDTARSAKFVFTSPGGKTSEKTVRKIRKDLKTTLTYRASGKRWDKKDGTHSFFFSDDYFYYNSSEYHNDLAVMSLGLEMSAYSSHDYDDQYTSTVSSNGNVGRQKNLNEAFGNLGFKKHVFFKYDAPLSDSTNYAAFGIAKKTISDETRDDTLIAVAIRGGGYGAEWTSNFDLSNSGDALGFRTAADYAAVELKTYIEDLKTSGELTGNIKIWLVGFSRGAATANILGHKINSGEAGIEVDKTNSYVYTFAAPNGQYGEDHSDTNIFNIISDSDIVPRIPLKKGWGFSKYGTTKVLRGCNTNKYVNKSFENHTGEKLLVSNAASSISGVVSWMGELVPDRASFVSMVQDSLMAEYRKNFSEKDSALAILTSMVGGILKSPQARKKYHIDSQFDKLWENEKYNEALRHAFMCQVGYSAYTMTGANIADDLNYILLNSSSLISQLHSHCPEHYLAWLESGGIRTMGDDTYAGLSKEEKVDIENAVTNQFNNESVKEWEICCPVNVTVYSSGGNVVGEITDDTVGVSEIPCFVDGDTKIVYFPAGDNYQIRLTGTDYGKMDYTVREFSEDCDLLRTVKFVDVELSPGIVYEADVSNNRCDPEETYALTDGQIVTVPALDSERGIFDPLYFLNVNGGFANSYYVMSGEEIALSADAPEGDTFVKWLADDPADVLIEDPYSGETSVRISSRDTTVTAHFASDHQWDEDYTVDVEPTLKDAGSKSFHCSVCGEIKEGSQVEIPSYESRGITGFGSCGEKLTWTLTKNGVLTVSGQGDMYDFILSQGSRVPWPRGEIKSVIVEKGVTSIGDYAFSLCSNLSDVSISDSVKSIGKDSFSYCLALTKIIIPGGVLSIGNYAFSSCTGLVNVTISEGCTSIGTSAFSNCSSLEEIYVPGSVETIETSVFIGCISLENLTVSEGVKSIGTSAFERCSSLKNVNLPGSLEEIGWSAFRNCTSLTDMIIPEGVLKIGFKAFYSCTGLESVSIPSTVTTLDNMVFTDCTNLKVISAAQDSGTFSSIDGVLYNKECTKLICYPEGKTGAFCLPGSVTAIEIAALAGCIGLTEITVEAGNSSFSAADGMLFNKKGSSLVCCPAGKEGSYIIPNGVEQVGYYAFYGCQDLTAVIIPEGVKTITMYAFEKCSGLTRLSLPGSLTTIGSNAFSSCSNLDCVVIRKGLASIGTSPFTDCSSLSALYFMGSQDDWNTITIADDNGDFPSDKLVFVANANSLSYARVTGLTDSMYTGTAIRPKPLVSQLGIVLEEGKDYSLAWSNNVNAGTATVTVTGLGNYVDSATAYFTINPASISGADVTGLASKTYTGKALTQTPAVKIGSTTLASGTDYSISYENNTNAGTAAMTITGKGNYTGSISKNFTINKAAQSITAKAGSSPIAVGKATIVSVTGAEGTKSFKSSDTTIATVDSKTGKVTARKVGTVKITATSAATANYNAASKTVTIKVVPAATTSLTAANQVTGIKLTWKKVAGANGYLIYRGSTLIKTITNGNTVSFVDKKANTNGTRYVYKVVAKAATGTSRLSKSVAFFRVARPVISSLRNVSSKKMKVKWGKNAKATGYKILYSRSKTFISGNKSVTFAGASNVSKVIGNLTKRKTYYVSVRAYKIVGGKVYWSEWSAVKGVKISK